MIDVRPYESLGTFRNDWLDAHYHFSFSAYRDPKRDHWGALRVWNDDTIQPHTGFSRHGHRDMEIITYMRRGAITHRDHLGNDGRTVAGDVQVMSAGRGIEHEEQNLEDGITQLFQIWIVPNENGVKPHWKTRAFPKGEQSGALVTLASGRKRDSAALPIHQDAAILAASLEPGQTVRHEIEPGRHLYLVPAAGLITVNGKPAKARDGVAITGEDALEITASEASEILIADVPAL